MFVAMSLEPRFEARFRDVIAPAIESLELNGVRLEAHRVDITEVSDSIVAEIVDGINNDVLIFVDITTIGVVAKRPVRNGNVMYELGLAHAIRQPEHVLIFRSDDDPLLFDVSGIRVRPYDPDGDVDGARAVVANALASAVDLADRFSKWSVDYAVASLDPLSLGLLMSVGGLPTLETIAPDARARYRHSLLQPTIHRLFELGLVHTQIVKAMSAADLGPASVDEMTDVSLTILGKQVLLKWMQDSGMIEAFSAATKDSPDQAGEQEAEL